MMYILYTHTEGSVHGCTRAHCVFSFYCIQINLRQSHTAAKGKTICEKGETQSGSPDRTSPKSFVSISLNRLVRSSWIAFGKGSRKFKGDWVNDLSITSQQPWQTTLWVRWGRISCTCTRLATCWTELLPQSAGSRVKTRCCPQGEAFCAVFLVILLM